MNPLLTFIILLFSLSTLGQEKQNDSTSANKTVLPSNINISRETPFYGLKMFTENDFFSPLAPNRDDNYTGGLKVDLITNQLKFLRLGKLFKKETWDIVTQNISYGFTVFTPQDLANDKIIRSDRPYACYEFISGGSSFVKSSTYKRMMGYEIFAGSMGSQTGKNFQTTIHKNHWFGNTRPIPQGWQYQIANGGAIAFNIKLFSETDIFDTRQTNSFRWLQTSWTHEVNIGQYLINYAQSIRFNLLNVNRDFGRSFSGIQHSGLPEIVNNNLPGSRSKQGTESKTKNFSFNLFLTPRIRVVGHNATLTGNLLTRSSEYSLSQKDVIPALLEYDMGINARWYFINVGANFNGRSREFKFEDKEFHNWGGVYLALLYQLKK